MRLSLLQTDAALMYDGVLSFCHGLKSFQGEWWKEHFINFIASCTTNVEL